MRRWVVLSVAARFAVAAVAAVAAAAGLAACAYGADGTGDGTTGYEPDASTGKDGGTRRDAGGTMPGVDAGTPPGSDAAPNGDDSGTGGTDGGGTDGGPPGGIPCDAPDSCGSAATSIGSVSGDSSSNPVSSSGQTSQWLVLDVTEDDSGIFGVPMNLSVSLTSPPGENFDLFVYLAGNSSAIECSKVGGSSTNGAGQVDTATLSWGEMGTFSNGSDDSAHVTIEVRSASGNTCSSSASWQLSAQGN